MSEISTLADLWQEFLYFLNPVRLPWSKTHRAAAMRISDRTANIANGMAAMSCDSIDSKLRYAKPHERTVISGSFFSSFLMNLQVWISTIMRPLRECRSSYKKTTVSSIVDVKYL
jgi:hypothetical protein